MPLFISEPIVFFVFMRRLLGDEMFLLLASGESQTSRQYWFCYFYFIIRISDAYIGSKVEDDNVSSCVRSSDQRLYIRIGKNLFYNHKVLQEFHEDCSVGRNMLSVWASSFHTSRVNIAVLSRSRNLSAASNDTFNVHQQPSGKYHRVCKPNFSAASVSALKFAQKESIKIEASFWSGMPARDHKWQALQLT